jgi:transposase-like protein
MTVEERRRRRFSETLRKELVSKIELGELTIGEVSSLYQVKRESIKRWIDRIGKGILPVPILLQSYNEISRVRELEKQLKATKLIVGEQQIKIIHLEELNRISKARLGINFEKKIKN